MKTFFISSILAIALLLIVGNMPMLIAEMMTSNNYKIQSDSANFGGNFSTSTNYREEDTLGEIATGESASTNFNLHAGYQQMVNSIISMTAAADVTMSPTLAGLTGGTSNGSTATTITTDNPAGYALYIKASSTPAMKGYLGTNSIADYTPAGFAPDFTFSVPATAGEFGFTPESTDVVAKYKDDGVANCNTGSSLTADACWNALSTSNETISSKSSANNPSGTVTTVKFRITLGSSHLQIADTYQATTTLTAIAL